MNESEYSKFVFACNEVQSEYEKAVSQFGKFESAHEGYAVILEELDELWDQIKKKIEDRNSLKMRKEAMQVAAMALRFMVDLE